MFGPQIGPYKVLWLRVRLDQDSMSIKMLHSHIIHMQPYTYTCGNIVNIIKTSGHCSLEKYTSHTLFEMVRKGYERVMCERWVGDWTKTATYWPPTLLAIAALLSHPAWLLNLRAQLPAGSGSHSSNCNNWLQTLISNSLNPCRTWVISLFDVHLLPMASKFALNSTRRLSRLSPDIFDRMHLLFTQENFSSDSWAGSEVNML